MTSPGRSPRRPDRTWIWGPVPRRHASIDESAVAHRLFKRCGTTVSTPTMVDVGAHHGSSCMRFAREGWRVVAFEPDPINRKVFEQNLLDDWDVAVDVRALSDRETSDQPFYRSEISTGISGLRAFHKSHDYAGVVNTTTLSRILTEYGIHHVDFLKTDTEGNDLVVLRGYGWDVDRPDVVVCEFDDSKCEPGTASQQAELLLGMGYDVVVSEWHALIQFGVAHDFRGLWLFQPGDRLEDVPWGNLIALRPGMLEHLTASTDDMVDLRARSVWAMIRSQQAAPKLGGPKSSPAVLRALLRRSLGQNARAVQRAVWKRIPSRHQPQALRLWTLASSLLHSYLTPSGLVLLVLTSLLAAGFLVHGLFGVVGAALLSIFLLYRFGREKSIAARTSGAAFNAAQKASTAAHATSASLGDRMDAMMADIASTRNRLTALARSLEESDRRPNATGDSARDLDARVDRD